MRLIPLVLPLLLAACAATSQNPHYLHQVPMGTVLSLVRPLPFKANSVRAYLQKGKVYPRLAIAMNYGGADQRQPYCALELRHKSDTPLTLSPRRFVITGVAWDSTYANFDNAVYRTRWYLGDDGTPQALYFTCYRLDSASHGTPIRLDEVDAIVGDYFRLIPATKPPRSQPTQ